MLIRKNKLYLKEFVSMKKLLLSSLLMLLVGVAANAQVLRDRNDYLRVLFIEEFDRVPLDEESGLYSWSFVCEDLKPKVTVSQPEPGELAMTVASAGGKGVFGDCYGFIFVDENAEAEKILNLNSFDLVSVWLRLKSDQSFRLTVNLRETDNAGGDVTDGYPKYIDIIGDGEYHTYKVYYNKTDFVTWDARIVDRAQIRELQIFFAKNEETAISGTITFDAFLIQVEQVASLSASSAEIASSKLYPNPTSESASLELSLKEASDVKVTLSDFMGREVAVIANERSLDVNKSFSTANLAKGMYTVNYFINGAPAKAELLMVK
jgi:hypothetical protein